MAKVLHDEPTFSQLFIAVLQARNARMEEDLVDQLFNSTEKRLARCSSYSPNFGKDGSAPSPSPSISQETLAEMIGTTRSRVAHFMNKFRRLGFIDYNNDGLHVHSSLLNVICTTDGEDLCFELRGSSRVARTIVEPKACEHHDWRNLLTWDCRRHPGQRHGLDPAYPALPPVSCRSSRNRHSSDLPGAIFARAFRRIGRTLSALPPLTALSLYVIWLSGTLPR